ncbi:MAG TPA: tRNA preQ1(34) S-adenosylmethionine ribosyltransferase-isomerase QueA [Acidimicrobium sp.]|nr:MAG: S-adenosylmethionine:tRNA ribosyltransferase-isomerase [Acidimicrobium sp. BACL27 MAG-120823-bin4]MDP5087856.1 tRNA preQ1(34) S-adenosylmethionine ribosyltransferase-isomerase QueA [Ilumatobacteraceae bacterium]HBZ62087.1 tRNA preQ1(34) S-adenosylmethionine ribosyltransferase-isomerase QueA [Acidimicrobium sp.]
MQIKDFDYNLPTELIAQTPVEPRDSARLLVDQGSGLALHRQVRDFIDFCRPGDVVVVNDTKVIPARLRLVRESGGAAEVLLLEQDSTAPFKWEALIRPAKRLKLGETLFASDNSEVVRIGDRTKAGDTFSVELVGEMCDDVEALLKKYGEMPLPPYIETRLEQADRYQTVYANRPASAAAPTAGLHFTPKLLTDLKSAGIKLLTVDLTVGLDTFAPVTSENPLEHPMHSEHYRVTQETLEECARAERVIAVGTTATRALESAATSGVLSGRTKMFISRGYEFKVVDLLLTNFHMPRTTLLMMIEAFVGPRWRDLYSVAIAERYRMLSFGDAMLLNRHL